MSEEVYGAVATEYYEKGWKSVLPLNPKTKDEGLPRGYTGAKESYPSYPDIYSWTETRGDGNVCIRLPHGVIGIDVDAYGGKSGDRTFIEAQNRWGGLPPTVRSTSRKDGVSGIRLYRVPEELSLQTKIGFPELGLGGIEICQWSHRYVVCYPSVHPHTGVEQDEDGNWLDPEGNVTFIEPGDTYQWLDEGGNPVGIPALEDIPFLPRPWIDALRRDAVGELTNAVDAIREVQNFEGGSPSQIVNETLKKAFKNLDTAPESRHDVCMVDVGRLVRLGYGGEPGVRVALGALRQAFIVMVSDRSNAFDAGLEFDRLVKNPRIHQMIQSTPDRKMDERALGIERSKPTTGTSTQEPSSDAGEDDSGAAQAIVESMLGGSVEDDFLFTGEYVEEESKPVVNSDNRMTEDRTGIPFKDRLYRANELERVPPAVPLVEGLLYRNTLAQIAGDPGSYKSFFTVGLACAVANMNENRPRTWEGHEVKHHGTVIYVAAEGLSGMRVRVNAWCKENGCTVDDLDLLFFPDAFDLASWEQVTQVVEMVEQNDCCLLVLDTRARLTGELDENKADEQNKAIASLDRIRNATQASILAVHHSSRSGAAGRGSNAWDGAVWTELRSSRTADFKLKVHCEKHKDVVSGCDHLYDLKKVVVDESVMPEVPLAERTTLVVHEANPNARPTRVSEAEKNKVVRIVSEHAPRQGLTYSQIRNIAVETGVCAQSTVTRLLKAATESGSLVDIGTDKTPRYVLSEQGSEAENARSSGDLGEEK